MNNVYSHLASIQSATAALYLLSSDKRSHADRARHFPTVRQIWKATSVPAASVKDR